jgi:hypothetical protein
MVAPLAVVRTPHFDALNRGKFKADLTGGATFPMFRSRREADSAICFAAYGG